MSRITIVHSGLFPLKSFLKSSTWPLSVGQFSAIVSSEIYASFLLFLSFFLPCWFEHVHITSDASEAEVAQWRLVWTIYICSRGRCKFAAMVTSPRFVRIINRRLFNRRKKRRLPFASEQFANSLKLRFAIIAPDTIIFIPRALSTLCF